MGNCCEGEDSKGRDVRIGLVDSCAPLIHTGVCCISFFLFEQESSDRPDLLFHLDGSLASI